METQLCFKNQKYYEIRSYPDIERQKKKAWINLPVGLFTHFVMELDESLTTPHLAFENEITYISKTIIKEKNIFSNWEIDKDFFLYIKDHTEHQDFLRSVLIDYPHNIDDTEDDELVPRCICGVRIHYLFKIDCGDQSVLIGSECIHRFGREEWNDVVNKLFEKYKDNKRLVELRSLGEFACWYCKKKNSRGGIHKVHHNEIKRELASSGKTREGFIDDMFEKIDFTKDVFCKNVYDYYLGTNELTHRQANCVISNMEEEDRQYYKFLQEIKMLP